MPRSTWIAFGDVHENISPFTEHRNLRRDMAEAGGVIVTGDLTNAGGAGKAARVLEAVSALNPNMLVQIGNMDKPEVTAWLEEKGWNLHRAARYLAPDVLAIGLGCSPFTPFGTPSEHPEAHLASWLETTWRNAPPHKHLVLVTHTPPMDTACDKLANGASVGSSAVREFIEEVQPALCLCGHIHESRAHDRLGRTAVLNPGALVSGGYVHITVENEGVRAELRGL